jgi:hypothetical protein
VGACCIDGNTQVFCVILSQAACALANGRYNGDGTACTADRCPQPTGACCTRDDGGKLACIQRTRAACKAAGGTFFGAGSECEDGLCTRCPCDFNGDGTVNDHDIAKFLEAYQMNDADVNGDGVTDQGDLEAFMTCLRNPVGC